MSQGNFTITEAAKLYGKQRATLYRHIKKGQLSYSLENDGTKRINLSELIRIYGEPPAGDTKNTRIGTRSIEHHETPKDTPNLSRYETVVNELKASHARETALMRELLDAKQALIEAQQKLLPSPERSTSKKWWQFWK